MVRLLFQRVTREQIFGYLPPLHFYMVKAYIFVPDICQTNYTKSYIIVENKYKWETKQTQAKTCKPIVVRHVTYSAKNKKS
jgi:hypothetical protein